MKTNISLSWFFFAGILLSSGFAQAGDLANAFRCNEAKSRVCVNGAQTLGMDATAFDASGNECQLKTEKVFQFADSGVTFESTALSGKPCLKIKGKLIYVYLGKGKLGIQNLHLKTISDSAQLKSARDLFDFLDPSAKGQEVKIYSIGDSKRYLAQSILNSEAGKVQIFDLDHRRTLSTECAQIGEAFLLNGETYFELSSGKCGSKGRVHSLYELVPKTVTQEILHNVVYAQ
jgi:hypothetical protein